MASSLCIDYCEEISAKVSAVLCQLVFEHGTRPNEEQILVWNKFMLKRAWRDEDDGSTQEVER